MREAAHLIQRKRLRAVVDRGREQEEERDRETMRDHEENDATRADDTTGGDAEERIAHVHDRAVTDHLLEVALGDGDEADDQDVTNDGEPSERVSPVGESVGEQREGNLDEAVHAEFFQDAGVEHRGGARRSTVTEGRPRVERPE